jgi:hypothetical protein
MPCTFCGRVSILVYIYIYKVSPLWHLQLISSPKQNPKKYLLHIEFNCKNRCLVQERVGSIYAYWEIMHSRLGEAPVWTWFQYTAWLLNVSCFHVGAWPSRPWHKCCWWVFHYNISCGFEFLATSIFFSFHFSYLSSFVCTAALWLLGVWKIGGWRSSQSSVFISFCILDGCNIYLHYL